MTKSEVIKIQDGDTVIELTGQARADFIADREATNVQIALLETEYAAKQAAKQNILKKLGLTQDELETLLGA